MNYIDYGAEFSDDHKNRFNLWRIWDRSLPLVMFIGLNPSTANATNDDPTIRKVVAIARSNGYGGVYMMNCFSTVSTDPSKIETDYQEFNDRRLIHVRKLCQNVVFAWGNFEIVKTTGRHTHLVNLFGDALAITINKNGSPKHPLYCRSDSPLIPFVSN